MAQDHDHNNQRSGNSSCGSGSSRSSKKLKQKKIPQRGLGVAQLEKIRLEEQQKKESVLPNVSLLQSSQNNNNSSPAILGLSFRQNPSSQIDQSSTNPIFESNPPIPNSDFSSFLSQNHVPFPKPSNPGQGNWGTTKLWNGEQILEGDSYRVDQSGFVFRPKVSVIYESNPIATPPNGLPRKDQFPRQNSSSSMVRVPSGTSSSSVITYNQMEPPSNQSFYSKIYSTSKWSEEDKMIGMKRSYPFSLDNPPGPAFPCKFPPIYVHPSFKSIESASVSCGNGGIVHVEPKEPLLREEGPPKLPVMHEPRKEKAKEQIGDLNGDFLTLALPKTAATNQNDKLFDTEPKSQGNADDPVQKQVPSLYSFFPSSKALNGQSTNTFTSCSGEVAEKLDLNLKL